ncbi:hypothetical protein JXQ31_05810 [candidate division KSB1 bacterium]|nr:hypothetical protein [candidate division KSB1 bacterium]
MFRYKIYYPALSLFMLFLFVSGCKDIETTTEIYADGSCKRTVVIQGDSSEIFQSAFPVPTDSSWTIETIDTSKFTYIATKKFNKVADLDKELNYCKDKSRELTIIPELTKRFRWFYTIFSFKETYKTFNKLNHVPFTEYFTPEEIKLFYSDDDSSAEAKLFEEKLEDWDLSNTFEEFYLQFEKAAHELKDPNLTVEKLRLNKERIFQFYKEKLYDNPEIKENTLSEFQKVLGADIKSKLADDLDNILKSFKERQDIMGEIGLNDYSSHVIMPGLIIDTNAKTVEGNKVSWEIAPKSFLLSDYEMFVESRVVNKWAVVVTIALVVFAAGILLLPFVLKKNP